MIVDIYLVLHSYKLIPGDQTLYLSYRPTWCHTYRSKLSVRGFMYHSMNVVDGFQQKVSVY